VNFAGHPRLVGQFADVVITWALPHSLRGEVRRVDADAESRGATAPICGSTATNPVESVR
jgi:hypothetical protein